MHFRCIDYLPPKQGEFKHICSKHQKKIASATQRKALNNSTSSAWPYLAIPVVEGSSLLDFSCCLASFPQAPVRNAKPRRLLFGANNVPLPVHLKTQKPSQCCSQTLPDVLHWREDRKTPLCLLHSALSSVQETVTSCLGPIHDVFRATAPALQGQRWWLNLCLQYPATHGNCISVFRWARYPQTKSLLT